MGWGLLVLTLLLLLVALFLLSLARRGREVSGLPPGRVVYVDSRDWEEVPAPLRAPRYRLVGRPDYLLRNGQAIIPVEVKPARRAVRPYEADLLQLAAYCLLVEEEYGISPPHGLLVYADRTFAVPFDGALRERLLESLAEMSAARPEEEVGRSHEQPARCAVCSMRRHCGEEAL